MITLRHVKLYLRITERSGFGCLGNNIENIQPIVRDREYPALLIQNRQIGRAYLKFVGSPIHIHHVSKNTLSTKYNLQTTIYNKFINQLFTKIERNAYIYIYIYIQSVHFAGLSDFSVRGAARRRFSRQVAQVDWTLILPSELSAKELRHLPRKMPSRGTTY
jgi:hypothetical protein